MRYLLIFESFEEFPYLRKEPKYIPLFKKLRDDEGIDPERLEELYKNIQTHRNTIKQNKIDLTKLENYESVVDQLTEVELIEKFNKFVKKLPSHLRNIIKNKSEYKTSFKNSLIGISYDNYKNNFIPKVSKYKTPDEFIKAFSNFVDKSSTSRDKLKREINRDNGAKIVYEDDQYLVALIYSKKSSCKYGSQQWCISGNTGGLWGNYVGSKMGVQYFVWDFSEIPSSIYSQIGITRYENNYTAHDKSDGKYIYEGSEPWIKYLRPYSKLSESEKENYFIFNLDDIPSNNQLKMSERLKRRILNINPSLSGRFFKDLDFLSDDEIKKIVNKNPEIYQIEIFNKRLSDDFVIDLLKRNPLLLKKNYKIPETITPTDIVNILFKVIEKFESGKLHGFRDFWAESNYDKLMSGEVIELISQRNIKITLEYFCDYFIDLDMTTINEILEEHEEEVKEILENSNAERAKSDFDNVKSYINNDLHQRFKDSDCYIFNARYVKKEVGKSPKTGKTLYEEVLKPERLVYYNPFKVNEVHGMRMRAMVQGDLRLYSLWVSKGLFDGKQYISSEELEEDYGDRIFDLIDQHKNKL